MIGIVLSNGESGVSERKERINTRARRGEEAQSTQRNDGRSGAQRVAPLGETALRRDPTQPGGRAGRRSGRVSMRHQNEYNVCRCSRGGNDGGRENPYAAAGERAARQAGQTCGGDAAVAVVSGGGSDPGVCGAE